MNIFRYAAIAALSLSLLPSASLAEGPSVKESLAGERPRFDYTMWLHPDLDIAESTIDPSLGYLARVRRMEEATVFIQNSKATSAAESMGSGVIIDNKNCWVVTNQHVIEGADFLNVTFINGWLADGTPLVEYVSASIIGYPGDSDQGFDLALLQMDHCEGAAWAPIIKDHTQVKVGEKAIAAGNPQGQTWSVTTGTVSHTARTTLNVWPMIQTDASVNPGNSGGPLFDQNGYIIGINTSILSRQRENNGLAFAGRSDVLRLFLNNMYRYGQMQINQIGVAIGGISKAEAEVMDIPGGVLVSSVGEGTPAQEAGIQVGDIITHIDDVLSTSQNRIIMSVWSAEPTVGAHARILRPNADGGYDALEMTIPVRNVWQPEYTQPEADVYDGTMGWTLDADNELNGVMVTDVAAMGPAHRISMKPSDAEVETKKGPHIIGGEQYLAIIGVETRHNMVITAVKAKGKSKLDLTNISASQRIAALEQYIQDANGNPVVLSITTVKNSKVTSAATLLGGSIELSDEDIANLNGQYGGTAEGGSFVLYAQPQAYSPPADLENWTPPATGN